MLYVLKWPVYLIISLLLTAVVFLVSWPLNFLSPLFGALLLLLNSAVLGQYLFIKNSWWCKLIFGFLFIAVFYALFGTISFYLWQINKTVYLLASLLLIPFLSLIVKRYPLIFEIKLNFKKISWKILTLTLIYLTFFGLMIFTLYNSGNSDSLRSPWSVAPNYLFYFFFCLSFILLAIIRFSHKAFPLFLTVLHFFLTFSVVFFVYKIGFDYDPFIHRENVRLILENATLLPKPFYYIGQYSLIIFFHYLLNIAPVLLDKLLVPIFASLFVPTTVYYAFKDNFKAEKHIILLSVFSLLMFPLTGFISTTPQSFSNLLFLITILLSLYYINHPKVSAWPLALLTILTIAIHPLSGLPLIFIFSLLWVFIKLKKTFKIPSLLRRSIIWEVVIIGGFALPVAFLINSLTMSQLKVSLDANWFINVVTNLKDYNFSFYYEKFISLTDTIYNYSFNIITILLSLVLTAVFFIFRRKQFKKFSVYLLGLLVILMNYYLLRGMISFFSLVSYEQITYPRRVLELAFYLLAPFIIMGLYLFYQKLLQQNKLSILVAFFLISLAITMNFYLLYPRVDKIAESHGYSTSETDLETVRLIENLEKDSPYIVLASQPVSAGAIKELSFRHYHNDYFFYPVPTGGELYQLYEELAYDKKPINDVIGTVRYLTGVKTVYFVINDYWFNASEVIAKHKEEADKWYSVDGKNYIFVYRES